MSDGEYLDGVPFMLRRKFYPLPPFQFEKLRTISEDYSHFDYDFQLEQNAISASESYMREKERLLEIAALRKQEREAEKEEVKELAKEDDEDTQTIESLVMCPVSEVAVTPQMSDKAVEPKFPSGPAQRLNYPSIASHVVVEEDNTTQVNESLFKPSPQPKTTPTYDPHIEPTFSSTSAQRMTYPLNVSQGSTNAEDHDASTSRNLFKAPVEQVTTVFDQKIQSTFTSGQAMKYPAIISQARYAPKQPTYAYRPYTSEFPSYAPPPLGINDYYTMNIVPAQPMTSSYSQPPRPHFNAPTPIVQQSVPFTLPTQTMTPANSTISLLDTPVVEPPHTYSNLNVPSQSMTPTYSQATGSIFKVPLVQPPVIYDKKIQSTFTSGKDLKYPAIISQASYAPKPPSYTYNIASEFQSYTPPSQQINAYYSYNNLPTQTTTSQSSTPTNSQGQEGGALVSKIPERINHI